MYDSMVKVGHKEANEKLKSSLEEILREKQQKEWTLEQMPVPQQTDKESCGYRMLYNMNKVCNQKIIESISNEEMALEGPPKGGASSRLFLMAVVGSAVAARRSGTAPIERSTLRPSAAAVSTRAAACRLVLARHA